jgi:molybdate transport system regulatory protein
MDVSLKVRIVDDRGLAFMGPGPLSLLERIGHLKSINKAAGDMKLSYVKALRMLDRLEQATGRRFVVRRRGGCDRGGAELTPYAMRFMLEFEKLESKLKKDAHAELKTFRKKVARTDRRRGRGRAGPAGRGSGRVQGKHRKEA